MLSSAGHAQGANQVYDGGTGQWDAGTTADWDGGANVWAYGNNAYFQAPTDSVTVSGTVTTNYMEFDSGVTSATISGGTIAQYPVTAYDPYFINDSASGPVSISSQIELSDMGGDEQTFINNYSSSDLEFGNIDFGAYTINTQYNTANPPNRRVNFYVQNAGASVTLNGTYTASSTYGYGQLNFNGNGSATAAGASVYNITSNANFSDFTNGAINNYGGGIFNVNNDTFLASNTLSATDADGFNEINIIGGHTGAHAIAAGIYDSTKNSGATRDPYGVSTYGVEHLNQSTADVTTWSGNINMDGSNLNLSAIKGGRLIVTDFAGNTPNGLVVSGDGVVVLANVAGNNYNEEEGQGQVLSTSTVAADLQSGTTLIENTLGGGAFGANVSYGGNGSVANHVNIEGGATLGGSGYVTQQVKALGVVGTTGASILAPGDPGDSAHGIAPSIGTLTLSGGLEAETGLTMNFKLDGDASNPGVNNDLISLTDFTLGGTVTINISNLATVDTSTAYQLISGSGDWTEEAGTNFVITAPAGYALDENWAGNGTDPNTGLPELGYDFDTGSDALYVKFVAVPEPSTYALLGMGLLALVVIGRRRRLAV